MFSDHIYDEEYLVVPQCLYLFTGNAVSPSIGLHSQNNFYFINILFATTLIACLDGWKVEDNRIKGRRVS